MAAMLAIDIILLIANITAVILLIAAITYRTVTYSISAYGHNASSITYSTSSNVT